eukprot:7962842-Pyramimonas_sp.AAC.1
MGPLRPRWGRCPGLAPVFVAMGLVALALCSASSANGRASPVLSVLGWGCRTDCWSLLVVAGRSGGAVRAGRRRNRARVSPAFSNVQLNAATCA